MKQFVVILIIILTFNNLFSQNNEGNVTNEFKSNLTFSIRSFTNTSARLTYNKKLWKRNYLRIGLEFYGDFQENNDTTNGRFHSTNSNYNIGINLGLGKNIDLKDKLELEIGFDFLFFDNIKYSTIDNPTLPERLQKTTKMYFAYGFDLHIGLFYNFSNNFSIGSSITPMIFKEIDNDNEINRIKFDLLNVSVIQLRYKFK
jgi:hypothetical protein